MLKRKKELASLDARITENKTIASNLKIYNKTFTFKAEFQKLEKLDISLTTRPHKSTIFALLIENTEKSIFAACLKLPFHGIDMRLQLLKNETGIQLNHDIKFGNDIFCIRFKLDRIAGKDSFKLAIFPKKTDWKLIINFLHDGGKLHFSMAMDFFISTSFSLDMRHIRRRIMTGQATFAIIDTGGLFSYKEPEKKQWEFTTTAKIIRTGWDRHNVNLLGIWKIWK